MISKFITENKDEILNNICELIKIPSISNESNAKPGIPFGDECKKALDYTLNLASSMGFKTKNVDGYCGYIEFGSGKDLLGIIGHLDVVPAGDGWTKCIPFEPTIENDKLYGRGAIDDKGPVIAALYAMKYIKDTMNVNKRIRLILGLNEEVSWKCIDYYKSHEELPTIGFSPDADFPVIYAEKGFLNIFISQTYETHSNIKIINLTCNNAINIVPKIAEATIELKNISMNEFISNICKLTDNYNFHIDFKQINDFTIKITSKGVSAHSAYLDLGLNALSRLLIVLNDLLILYNSKLDILEYFSKYIGIDLYGQKLGIDVEDESGKLTLNTANIKLENNVINLGLNMRIPVTIYPALIKQKMNDSILDFPALELKFKDEKPALYIPKNNNLVTTLCSVFNEVTGQNKEPITCPGATYARAFENVVSFGCNMPGNIDMCHQADEYINIKDLFTSIEIYIRALRKLTE